MRCVWSLPAGQLPGYDHSAVYPEEVLQPIIRASCPIGGYILDCFLGSGTTAIKAEKENRSCIGIECNPHFATMAIERIRKARVQAAKRNRSA
jgi:site-specific DNA-methyltransferase (adenine-specific)